MVGKVHVVPIVHGQDFTFGVVLLLDVMVPERGKIEHLPCFNRDLERVAEAVVWKALIVGI